MRPTTRGYYSIIQFCPDPSRLEAVNIGVALFCPDLGFLRARFGRRKTAVRRMFGKQDWEFMAAQRVSLEARFGRGEEEFKGLEDFESFVAKRASAFRLTTPRPVKVEDRPEKELHSLFVRLVGRQGEVAQQTTKQIAKELKVRFRDAGVEGRLQENVTIHPPALP